MQWEFAGRLGPPPGRYVVRRYAGDAAHEVVVVTEADAPRRRPRRSPPAGTVPVTRVTVIDASSALDPAAADWHRRARACLARFLSAHRVSSADPGAPDPDRALLVRAGVGTGAELAEGAWTKAEIKEVLSELHSDRDRVVSTLSGQEAELDKLMRDAGDGAGHDQADMGATSFERDQEIIVVNNEREKLAQIDRALARIADGTYGMCESCGNPIGKMRAMAFPRATLCMTCKQREERR